MRATLLLTASFTFAAATSAFAQSQTATSAPVIIGTSPDVTTRVVEPVTQSFDSLITAPIQYDENGVAKAQYFKASDLTAEQNQAFQEEINRVRTYQSQNGSATYVPNYTYEAAPAASNVASTSNYSTSSSSTYGSSSSSDSITYGSYAPSQSSVQTNEASPYASGSYEIDLYAPQTSSNVNVINESTAQSYAAATHTVAKGDTLYNLSKRYNVTVGQLQDENGLSDTTLSLGQALRIPSSAPYAASSDIAQPIFVSAPVRDGAVTRRIVQPVATSSRPTNTYAVLKKDTLYSIAKRTCVSVNDLAAQNGISDPSSLQLGQKLSLPLGHCQVN